MSEKKILLQLDTDPRPSAFDAVVAIDSGVDVLLPYSGVRSEEVRDLVYGAIFTRGVGSLRSTAIFVGGSDVSLGEEILRCASESFLGPLRVSLMLDSGGANTTAAAAVLAAVAGVGGFKPLERAVSGTELSGRRSLVLGSTGPVGRRVVRLLARSGSRVVAASRSLERASEVARGIRGVAGADVEAVGTSDSSSLRSALEGVEIVVAAGGPGVCLLPLAARRDAKELRVVIDLNAVPPEGVEGVQGADNGVQRDGVTAFGAIGVGGVKMKIHKACLARLFESNDVRLDAEEILEVGTRLAR